MLNKGLYKTPTPLHLRTNWFIEMINRILIRMKVVQLLYSYLLTRSDFKLLPTPERQTRDDRFGYETYINLLLLLLELSGYKVSSNSPLSSILNNKLSLKVAKSLSADSDIKEIIARGNNNISDFIPMIHILKITLVYPRF